MLQETSTKIKRILFDIFDMVAFLVFVIGLVLFIRFFIFNPYSVVGQSMEQTLHGGDFLIIDKMTPSRGELERGDIVVFVAEGRTTPFIKRIIGLPGETVKIENNAVTICDGSGANCNPLDETAYIPDYMSTTVRCNSVYNNTYTVDSGYFVLGDNRDHSTDSRCCFTIGCYDDANYTIKNDEIIGKLFLRLWPLSDIQKY